MTLEMERKKKRKTPEAMKNENELPQVGFEHTTLCTSDRCSYQLSYQGSVYNYVYTISIVLEYSLANFEIFL